jgi:hypothetical protein
MVSTDRNIVSTDRKIVSTYCTTLEGPHCGRYNVRARMHVVYNSVGSALRMLKRPHLLYNSAESAPRTLQRLHFLYNSARSALQTLHLGAEAIVRIPFFILWPSILQLYNVRTFCTTLQVPQKYFLSQPTKTS